jgi:xylulokinase
MWLQEHAPDVLARATTWLHMSDYIAWRLTGVAATDYSLASRTLVLNLSTLTWERSLIEAAGVPLHIFPPLQRGGSALGTLLPAAAAATSLPQHTVVGVGGHDHLCGAAALGACRAGRHVRLDGHRRRHPDHHRPGAQ